jgi:hypothetical protein
MSYTRKRATVEAITVDAALASSASEPTWLQTQLSVGAIVLFADHIEVRTEQGRLNAMSGDYIVFDLVTGWLSIMTAQRFELLYELV